ncbi:hypothetical protein HYS31_08405 [Candidatus Woesearchaeota archaeon]|nr:hypothetical protein [Candidatus Woesearchaeota archaeon]
MGKSQAALEFLTTYGWAFLVILITIGALYSFGAFDFAKYLPQKCTFTSQFKCRDFSLKPSEVRIKLANNLGEDIVVNSVQITNDAKLPISCSSISPSVPFSWTHDLDKDIVFSSCSGGAYIAGERVRLKISLRYYAINTPSAPNHWVNGRIDGRVTS